jgi:hypothetical protein
MHGQIVCRIEDLAAFWSSLPASGAAADAHAGADPAAEFRKSRLDFPRPSRRTS